MHIISIENLNRLIPTFTIQLLEEEFREGMPFTLSWKYSAKKTGKYNLVFRANFTEKTAGIN